MSSRNELFIVDDNVEVIKVLELTAKVAAHARAHGVCLSIYARARVRARPALLSAMLGVTLLLINIYLLNRILNKGF